MRTEQNEPKHVMRLSDKNQQYINKTTNNRSTEAQKQSKANYMMWHSDNTLSRTTDNWSAEAQEHITIKGKKQKQEPQQKKKRLNMRGDKQWLAQHLKSWL